MVVAPLVIRKRKRMKDAAPLIAAAPVIAKFVAIHNRKDLQLNK